MGAGSVLAGGSACPSRSPLHRFPPSCSFAGLLGKDQLSFSTPGNSSRALRPHIECCSTEGEEYGPSPRQPQHFDIWESQRCSWSMAQQAGHCRVALASAGVKVRP